MRHFCTYFDSNYLLRGLTLYRSLVRHAEPFVLWVLCLDEVTFDILSQLNLPNLCPIALHDLEQQDPELHAAKANRRRVEYYFTLSPSWPLYILEQSHDVQLVTYLDADLFFYANPEPIFDELDDGSVLIIGHRFPEHLRHLEVHGVYNVGLISFRDDPKGRACLERWREQCLEWCYDRVENGKFADQKYLDSWPEEVLGVRVLQHKGAGLAPWNWMRYSISLDGGSGWVDDDPLIFYHFHGLKLVNRWFYQPSEAVYGQMPRQLRRWFYGRYLRELARTHAWIRGVLPDSVPSSGSVRFAAYGYREIASRLRRGHLYPRLGFLAF